MVVLKERRKQWTEHEKTTLKKMWLRGDRAGDISKAIGKSKNAIWQMRRVLELPFHCNKLNEDQLAECWMNIDRLARKFKVPTGTIVSQLNKNHYGRGSKAKNHQKTEDEK